MDIVIAMIITLCVLVIIADYVGEILARRNIKKLEEEMTLKSKNWLLKNIYSKQ